MSSSGAARRVTSVAIDTGSLVGPRTGIGEFTSRLIEALSGRDGLAMVPYVTSLRAKLPTGTRRLAFPARWALESWGRIGRPLVPGIFNRSTFAGVDVVHGTNFVAPPSRIPRLITVHDCSLVTKRELVNPTVAAFVPVIRRAVATGAWLHTPSTFVAETAREIFSTDRIRVIPHGAPPPNSAPSRRPAFGELAGRPYLLALGTREHRKNHIALVRAFAAIHHELPDLSLVLLGQPGNAQDIIDEAIALLPRSAAEHIMTTGFLPESDRDAAMAHAHVLVYPSLDEGFGLPLLEAFQAGVPVVASQAGSLPEVAGDAALLVPVGDDDALAAAVVRAVSDESVRHTLIARGRRRVLGYSWRETADAFASLYRELAGH